MEEGNADHQKAVLIAICIFIGINGLIAIFGTIRTKALSHKTSEDVFRYNVRITFQWRDRRR